MVSWDAATRTVNMRLDKHGHFVMFLHTFASRPEVVPQSFEYGDLRMRPQYFGIEATRVSLYQEYMSLVGKITYVCPSAPYTICSYQTVDGNVTSVDWRSLMQRGNADPLTRAALNRSGNAIRDLAIQGNRIKMNGVSTSTMGACTVPSGPHYQRALLVDGKEQEDVIAASTNLDVVQVSESANDENNVYGTVENERFYAEADETEMSEAAAGWSDEARWLARMRIITSPDDLQRWTEYDSSERPAFALLMEQCSRTHESIIMEALEQTVMYCNNHEHLMTGLSPDTELEARYTMGPVPSCVDLTMEQFDLLVAAFETLFQTKVAPVRRVDRTETTRRDVAKRTEACYENATDPEPSDHRWTTKERTIPATDIVTSLFGVRISCATETSISVLTSTFDDPDYERYCILPTSQLVTRDKMRWSFAMDDRVTLTLDKCVTTHGFEKPAGTFHIELEHNRTHAITGMNLYVFFKYVLLVGTVVTHAMQPTMTS
jgi:hypothetical protein